MAPPRVALLGCGWFACAAHIPALLRLQRAGRLDLVALCSRSEASLDRARALLGRRAIRTYTDPAALLSDPEVDLVDIVLPIGAAPAAIRAALSASRHVVSEKPCAPTLAEGRSLLAFHASLPNPPIWAVAENWRFKPLVTTIAGLVAEGAIGRIEFADFRYMTYTGPAALGWRGTPDYVGGVLLDSGVHFVALLRAVVGEVERVSALVSQRAPHLPPADSVTATMQFAGGAEGAFRLSWAAREGDHKPALTLVGTKGRLHADFEMRTIEVDGAGGRRRVAVRQDTWVQGGVHEMLAHCVGAIAPGAQLRSSAAEALRDVAVVEAMLEAGRAGGSVRPAALDPARYVGTRDLATYDGVWRFRPASVVDCASVTEVSAAVATATAAGRQVRVMGSGYSWAPYVVASEVCLTLTGLTRIRHLDVAHRTVVVEAGVRLGDLTRALAAHGLSLPSLSFVSDATVGGVIATGTHGTSPAWGTLSDSVLAMTLVLASGEVRRVGPQSPPDELRAARVAVGMLGVIVEVELQVVAMPFVRSTSSDMDLPAFLARRPAILSAHQHVWVHWTLGRDSVHVEALRSRPVPTRGFHAYVTDDNAYWANRGLLDRVRRKAHRTLGGLLAPLRTTALRNADGAGQVWMSMQYAVPAARLEATIAAIRQSEVAKAAAGRVVEIKFLKRSDLSFLGCNTGGDAALFNLWWRVDEAAKVDALRPFEALMRRLGARPHWGKYHTVPTEAELRAAFPDWPTFEAVRARFDPTRTFAVIPATEGAASADPPAP